MIDKGRGHVKGDRARRQSLWMDSTKPGKWGKEEKPKWKIMEEAERRKKDKAQAEKVKEALRTLHEREAADKIDEERRKAEEREEAEAINDFWNDLESI